MLYIISLASCVGRVHKGHVMSNAINEYVLYLVQLVS
jgi:hypothetical protein